ncbi:MAG TPA: DUF554 domain-containing protein [Anaerolineaceae bacterium]|mgnify:FL=1|nr:DUF554 domain-containing protein [Anaerolineaceae bacterium]
MTGTIINTASIILGGLIGLFLGSRIKDHLKQTVVSGLGLFTLSYAISLFLKTQNPLIVLGSLLLGILLGEWWKIEEGLAWLGVKLESKVNRGNGGSEGSSRFIKGFLTSTLLFVIGPMAILGAIQDGLTGDANTLLIKSILDGFTAMAFASTMGVGVVFSAFPVLIYQGSITLLAQQVQQIASDAMMTELTATGGVILAGLAISSILEIKKIRTGSFLPALIIAPILVFLVSLIK